MNKRPKREENGPHHGGASPWWKRAVVYQIYPRSFQDSDGDGVGDLRGITSRLDYLAGTPDSLGIDAIWLSPFYPSPMRDFGYDVADYTSVDPRFGTIDDFRTLVDEAHKRGVRIIIDLVLNHSADTNPWFREARARRDSARHDWYIWHPGLPQRTPLLRRFLKPRKPNNWLSMFEVRSGWHWNRQTQEYYLATFTKHQPELNWRNPELRRTMYDVMRFWLDEGVDGFRLDVINWFVKDAELRSNPWRLRVYPDLFQRHIYDRNRPETHEICREMRSIADSYGDRLLVGEVFDNDAALAASYHGHDNDELHLAFNFELLFQPWNAGAFAEAARRWYRLLPIGAWPNFTLSNHDQPRHASRYGGGSRGEARARVAATMLLTVKGTPFLYYGEELGMRNRWIPRHAIQDPLGRRTWPLPIGRDGARTPMQWNAERNAGFSDDTPWLPVHPDFESRNVTLQQRSEHSLLTFYRRLLELRRQYPALESGEITFVPGANRGRTRRGARKLPAPAVGKHVLAYFRHTSEELLLICLNFVGRRQLIEGPGATAALRSPELSGRLPFTPDIDTTVELLFGTHRSGGTEMPLQELNSLAADEALVARLRNEKP